jgi:hypothetical protein
MTNHRTASADTQTTWQPGTPFTQYGRDRLGKLVTRYAAMLQAEDGKVVAVAHGKTPEETMDMAKLIAGAPVVRQASQHLDNVPEESHAKAS